MARYDYSCVNCSFSEEKVHSMKESPNYSCPKCGNAMERQFSLGTGFIIKGESISKDWKEERYRVKRSAEIGVKQVERYGSGPTIRPIVAQHPASGTQQKCG